MKTSKITLKPLLAELDEADVKEEIVLPRNFHPVKHMARLLSQGKPKYPIAGYKSTRIVDNVVAYYLLEHAPLEVANHCLKEGSLEKLLLLEAAVSVTKKFDHDFVGLPLPKLAIAIAAELYRDIFTGLCEPIYLNPAKKKKTAVPAALAPAQNHSYTNHSYAVVPESPLLAASRLCTLLAGQEQRLSYLTQPAELSLLAGTQVYHSLLKNQPLRQELQQHLLEPRYTMTDIFLYAVLKLHQDFFLEMEKE